MSDKAHRQAGEETRRIRPSALPPLGAIRHNDPNSLANGQSATPLTIPRQSQDFWMRIVKEWDGDIRNATT
jgi:hypothetical protein